MKNFGFENNDHYVVVLDGCNVVYSCVNKKRSLRKCILLSMNPSNYVELWYQNSVGSCSLVDYWN